MPLDFIAFDSVWLSPFTIQLDHHNFYDTAKVKILEAKSGNTTVEAVCQNLKVIPGLDYLYGYKLKFQPITSGKGSGKYRITTNPKGYLLNMSGEFQSEVNVKLPKVTFHDEINTTFKAELLRMIKN
jgi:hypothetical protein